MESIAKFAKIRYTRQRFRVTRTWMGSRGALGMLLGISLQLGNPAATWAQPWIKGPSEETCDARTHHSVTEDISRA
jgi:hypothetical protein